MHWSHFKHSVAKKKKKKKNSRAQELHVAAISDSTNIKRVQDHRQWSVVLNSIFL